MTYKTDFAEGADACRRRHIQVKMNAVRTKMGVSKQQTNENSKKKFLGLGSSNKNSSKGATSAKFNSSAMSSNIGDSTANSTASSMSSSIASSASTMDSTIESTASSFESSAESNFESNFESTAADENETDDLLYAANLESTQSDLEKTKANKLSKSKRRSSKSAVEPAPT